MAGGTGGGGSSSGAGRLTGTGEFSEDSRSSGISEVFPTDTSGWLAGCSIADQRNPEEKSTHHFPNVRHFEYIYKLSDFLYSANVEPAYRIKSRQRTPCQAYLSAVLVRGARVTEIRQ
jgi:hypothetical protein